MAERRPLSALDYEVEEILLTHPDGALSMSKICREVNKQRNGENPLDDSLIGRSLGRLVTFGHVDRCYRVGTPPEGYTNTGFVHRVRLWDLAEGPDSVLLRVNDDPLRSFLD